MNIRRLRWRFYKKSGGSRLFGRRCKAYFGGCMVCESYRYLELHGRFPTFDEVAPICDEEAKKSHEAWLTTEVGRAWASKPVERRAP